MSRRYVRMTVQTRSGKPVTVLERAGASEVLSWIVAAFAAAGGFILLVGAG